MSVINNLSRRIAHSQQMSRVTREDQILTIQDGFERQMVKLNKLERDYRVGRISQEDFAEQLETIENVVIAFENWLDDIL